MPVLCPQSPATAAREKRAQRLFEEGIEEEVRRETVQECLEEIVSKLENMRLEPFQTRSQGTQTTDLPSVVPKPTPASIVTGYLEDGNTMLSATIMRTFIDYPYYSLCASDVRDLLQCGANPALKDVTMAMTPLMHACVPFYHRNNFDDWDAHGEYRIDLSLIDTLLALIILGLDNVPSTKQGVHEAFQSTRRSHEDAQKKRRLEDTKGTGGSYEKFWDESWGDEAGPVSTWSKLDWAKEVLIEFISDNAKRQVSQSAEQGQPQIGAGQSDAMGTTLMIKNARKLKGRDCEECGRSWADVHGHKARSNRPPVIHGRQRFVDLQLLSTRESIKTDLQMCPRLKDQTIVNQAYELTEACRAIAPAFQKNGDGQSASEWICPDCYVKAVDKLLDKTTEEMPEVVD